MARELRTDLEMVMIIEGNHERELLGKCDEPLQDGEWFKPECLPLIKSIIDENAYVSVPEEEAIGRRSCHISVNPTRHYEVMRRVDNRLGFSDVVDEALILWLFRVEAVKSLKRGLGALKAGHIKEAEQFFEAILTRIGDPKVFKG